MKQTILIVADALRPDYLGAYGNKDVFTPTVDRMAADGLRFSQFYNTAKCHSSRISLMHTPSQNVPE